MVVQRDRPVSVWGKAEPGAEVVALTLKGGKAVEATATAGADGRFRAELPPSL